MSMLFMRLGNGSMRMEIENLRLALVDPCSPIFSQIYFTVAWRFCIRVQRCYSAVCLEVWADGSWDGGFGRGYCCWVCEFGVGTFVMCISS